MSAIGFDHLGFIVEQLEQAHALFTAMGFRISRRADHTMTTAEGKVVPAGSSQHTVMFEHGYIELMQITDRSLGHPLAAALDARYGLHILALSADDAQAAHSDLQSRAVPIGPLRHWSRPIEEADRSGTARFAFFDTAWNPWDPSYVCWVQHLTPGLVRSAADTTHPNTARSVRGLRYRGARAEALAWYERLCQFSGQSAVHSDFSGPMVLDLGTTRIEVQASDSAEPVRPIAVELDFTSLATLRQHLSNAGLPYVEVSPGTLELDLQSVLGLRLFATQH